MNEYIRHTPEASAYTHEISAVLPRVLALIDNDRLSPTYGIADRQFWAWKLIDFPNATFQGAANGLAHLLAANLFEDTISRCAITQRIESLLEGTRKITRRDGSLEEALPFERSFCVTALVAFDFLRTCDDLSEIGLSGRKDDFSRTITPLVQFIKRTDETHGFIANHLATGAAALFRWHRLEGDNAARRKGEALLERILAAQSEEGWFPEYGGADPGYQTLCLTYLADVANVAPDERLDAALQKAASFLKYFAHPDGSFGGLYGSRNTRIYYPAGIEALTALSPDAQILAGFMRSSITRQATVPLSAIDQPNLAPMFNTYCWAGRLAAARTTTNKSATSRLPALQQDCFRKDFPAAGIVVDHSDRHHTVISTHKGGVVCHFGAPGSSTVDAGAAWRDAKGRLYTSQTFEPKNVVTVGPDGRSLTITSRLRRVNKPIPTAFNFLVLRLLATSVMRIPAFSDLIKRTLARWLILAKGTDAGSNQRTIRLGTDLSISDRCFNSIPLTRIEGQRAFSVIHMASQGYWQLQDDAALSATEMQAMTSSGTDRPA